MRLDRIRLKDFRSYREKEIRPGHVTVLVGPNASGKTNLIEAARLATATTSFRNPTWSEVPRWGSEQARVEIDASGESSSIEIRLDVSAQGTREYSVNGNVKRRLSDVSGLVPSVVFTPDDLGLVKESAQTRRDAVDEIGALLWPTYGRIAADYGKVVRQRNRLLKDGVSDDDLAPWTQQVVDIGGRLLSLRLRLLGRVHGHLSDAYNTIAGTEHLSVEYRDANGLPASALEEGMEPAEASAAIGQTIERRSGDERRRLVTLGGPHRDDIAFLVDSRDARAYASQGQQRSIALAWKVAELRTLQAVTGRKPVLLLDDVMSELDEGRRRALTDLVGEETQTFITTTNLGYFDERTLQDATVFELP